jgi:beta-mannosidase
MKTAYPVTSGWQLARVAPGTCAHPDDLPGAPLRWQDAQVPGTVAGALASPLDAAADHDAHDWWYRTTFVNPGTHPGDAPRGASPSRHYLRFDGLATLAQVWLNGERILESRNMFVGHRVDVTGKLRDLNTLTIRFASLDREMAVGRKPRAKWKTQLVTHQGLRWFRTTLLGRMPGWNPMIPVVGPWGDVALECVERFDVTALEVHALAEGTRGRVVVRAAIDALGDGAIEDARLRIGDHAHALQRDAGERFAVHGDIAITDAPLWWPHTHGTPRRHRCRLEVKIGGEWLGHDIGSIGFKAITYGTHPDAGRRAADRERAAFCVNGVPVFLRGAVWTTMDIRTLRARPGELRRALEMARDAGVNLLRIGGTMCYEHDEFYELCDELGILVWQDFMFANMDYPMKDAAFRAGVEDEACDVLSRLQRHACIAAYCGGSEIAQQAAMMGLGPEHWSNDFFEETLPALCAQAHPDIPYFPSTPWGGALPFHVSSGIAHYYGVGAYRRPLSDVKVARVKFAAEALAFSNAPDAAAMASLVEGNAVPPPHHPKWKARVPRDNAAAWDFEDVRDHYLRELFEQEPVVLRSHDLERYYALSRVVSGEVMARTFAEWRAAHSGCGGALVWTWRDVWPGAGWGLTDSDGNAKPALWHLKRIWAPRTVFFTDEGLDGLAVHVANDCDKPLDVRLELAMYRDGRIAVGAADTALRIPARAAVARQVDGLFGYFTDASNAYRFGPPRQDLVLARLVNAATGETIADAFHFPAGYRLPTQHSANITCDTTRLPDGKIAVAIRSDAFLQSLAVSCEGFTPDDNYFHVAPGREKRVVFTPRGEAGAFRASCEALNLREAIVAAVPVQEVQDPTRPARTSAA